MPLDRVVEGEGPLVVMVHGAMDRGSSFMRTVMLLDEFKVVVYDRCGYARATECPPPTGSVIASHAADLNEIIEAEGGPATVIGHSYGGIVALKAAVDRPDLVTRVGVFESPMPWLAEWPASTAGGSAAAAGTSEDAAEAFLRRMLGNRRWDDMPEQTKRERRAEGAALQAEMMEMRTATEPPFDLAAISQPTVLASGTTSPRHLIWAVDRMAEIIPGATRMTIEGAGHGAHLTHPRQFAEMVRAAANAVPFSEAESEIPD